MSELGYARLVGNPEGRGIPLATLLGTAIENSQAPQPSKENVAAYRLMQQNHPFWMNRKPCTGIYNCHGHVWASRRTAVYRDQLVHRILLEDGYRPLVDGETLCVGDVVVYRGTSADLGILHSGRIAQVPRDGNPLDFPWVLSKWNDSWGEDLHRVNDVPYPDHKIDFSIEYWTERGIDVIA